MAVVLPVVNTFLATNHNFVPTFAVFCPKWNSGLHFDTVPPQGVCLGCDMQLHSKGYQYLLDIDGWVLLLGVGVDRCASLHLPKKQ